MKQLTDYTIIIRPDPNGNFVAHVPAIPGCHAFGHTMIEAQTELEHVFDMIREEYEAEGRPLPDDCEVKIAHAG